MTTGIAVQQRYDYIFSLRAIIIAQVMNCQLKRLTVFYYYSLRSSCRKCCFYSRHLYYAEDFRWLVWFHVFPFTLSSWTTSGPSWCRQWRKPIRSTPSPVELMVSWSLRDPCSLRPIWVLCPSSIMRPNWVTPWLAARSASKTNSIPKLQQSSTHLSVLHCAVRRQRLHHYWNVMCNQSEFKLSMRCPHFLKLVSQTSGQPVIGKWCAAVHGPSTCFFFPNWPFYIKELLTDRLNLCRTSGVYPPYDICWREMNQSISLSLWTCGVSFSKLMWCLDFERGTLSVGFLLQGESWTQHNVLRE